MKKNLTLACVTILLAFTASSCGVMFGGSKYEGTIVVKDHPGADIYVNGEKIGTGTVTKLLPREKPLSVEVRKAGCEPKIQNYDKAFRTGNFILSVLSFGVIGIGVDLGTGAAYKPDHKNNTSIKKVSDKKFNFEVDYSGCTK